MDQNIKNRIFSAVQKEPFAQALNIKLIALEKEYSEVEMIYRPDDMNNIYQRIHGGAIFALIDEAFETVSQTEGTIAVALNVNVTYIISPEPGTCLKAVAKEIAKTRKTATYDIRVTDSDNRLIATCQALAYRTGKPMPDFVGI